MCFPIYGRVFKSVVPTIPEILRKYSGWTAQLSYIFMNCNFHTRMEWKNLMILKLLKRCFHHQNYQHYVRISQTSIKDRILVSLFRYSECGKRRKINLGKRDIHIEHRCIGRCDSTPYLHPVMKLFVYSIRGIFMSGLGAKGRIWISLIWCVVWSCRWKLDSFSVFR